MTHTQPYLQIHGHCLCDMKTELLRDCSKPTGAETDPVRDSRDH